MDKESELRFPPEHIVRRRQQKAQGERSEDLFTKLIDAAEEREWKGSLRKLEDKGLIPEKKKVPTAKEGKQPEW